MSFESQAKTAVPYCGVSGLRPRGAGVFACRAFPIDPNSLAKVEVKA